MFVCQQCFQQLTKFNTEENKLQDENCGVSKNREHPREKRRLLIPDLSNRLTTFALSYREGMWLRITRIKINTGSTTTWLKPKCLVTPFIPQDPIPTISLTSKTPDFCKVLLFGLHNFNIKNFEELKP